MEPELNWLEMHHNARSFGDRVADRVAAFVGSWRFIGLLTAGMAVWVAGNIYLLFHFDPFPFIFLNLGMSAMAAYSTPIIMMAQNRAADRDRHNAEADYHTNLRAKEEIETLIAMLAAIDEQKLNDILRAVRFMADTSDTIEHVRRTTEHAALLDVARLAVAEYAARNKKLSVKKKRHG